jgi:hypothetical protein
MMGLGALMAIISLDRFFEDTIVLHFGGEAGSIDAYTFAEALIGFADTAYAVSSTIDPGQEIEIIIEATGPGSFRAVIRRLKKKYGGTLSPVAGLIFWGVVTNLIYDATLKKDDPVLITVNTNEVIVKHGHDTVIVPRNVYDASENAKKNPAVAKGIKKTFETIERDPNITEFGLTSSIHDPQPLVTIPRADFSVVTRRVVIETEDPPSERTKTERARLVILKAWLNHAKRKWTFEWNGVPISAPISDREFLDKLDRREFLLGAGDALDVEITYKQAFDPAIRVYVNDPNSFVITRVIKPVPRA